MLKASCAGNNFGQSEPDSLWPLILESIEIYKDPAAPRLISGG